MTTLTLAEWTSYAEEHTARVDVLLAGHLERRTRREAHPVEDFLFTYYPTRPNQLRVWHPGPGVRLEEATAYGDRRGYVVAEGTASLDPAEIERRADSIRWIRRLLASTLDRQPQFGCFGLHEWAMVYRTPDVRHASWPLRLGAEGTDQVVESHKIGCSHFDAFRFFTDSARPLNTLSPGRDDRAAYEQPGCLHAGMDLYKHAFRLTPLVPSELVADCFELAYEVRQLDMRASPYDFSRLGVEPVRIETAEGKAAYLSAQQGFAERGSQLRLRLVDVCVAVEAAS